jgi:hypothetical protein
LARAQISAFFGTDCSRKLFIGLNETSSLVIMGLRKEREGKTQTVMIVKYTNKNTADVDDRQPPAAMMFNLTSTQENCMELA